MEHRMKRVFHYAFLCSSLLILLAACNEESDLYTVPEGTVAVTVGSNFSANADLGAQGVPYDPDTGASGIENAQLRVFEGEFTLIEDSESRTEFFFDAEGNLVEEDEAESQVLTASNPAATLFLPPGDYTFIALARPLATGLLSATVTDGDTFTVPLVSNLGRVELSAPEEVVPNEVFDVFLEVSAVDRPDLRVPASDYSVSYRVESESGDATVLGESNQGVRIAAECEEITVTASVGTASVDDNFDDEATPSTTIPLSTTCEGTSVGVDLVPPFVSITSPEAGTPFSGAFTLSGEVNDMQSGVDRVEIYDGPVLLGEADLDTSVMPNTWSLEIDPDGLRDYRLIALAYDNATNENRAELQVSAPSPADLAAQLQEAVTIEGLRAHQAAWQAIADENDGNRYAGLPGYELSAEYVYNLLQEAGYDVEYQEFEYDAFAEITDSELAQVSPNEVSYTREEDFIIQSYSGSGEVSAEVTPVDLELGEGNTTTSGCEAEDFLDFPEGNIALIQRGACTFQTKAEFAEAVGASAVVILNQGDSDDEERTGLFGGTLTSETITTIPVVNVTYDLGVSFSELSENGLELRIFTDALRETLTTRNVIAESVAGNPDTVVMAGAHLDSVSSGPGIQDNGTGSAAILEIALQMAEQFGVNDEDAILLNNKVRFAWWSAEESGLIGSTNYVTDLAENDPEALEDIALYLNFDMIGSPNFIRGVYDGNQSTFEAPVPVPAGSEQLENIFETFYEDNDLAYQDVEFSGRSDYQAFINNGVPAGGLFTGAEGIKTEEEEEIYGGTAGDQYDPCYHEACDTFDNISLEAFDQNSDAVAYAVATLAAGDVEEILGAPLEPARVAAQAASSTSGGHDHHEEVLE